jgi:hypothetical protein
MAKQKATKQPLVAVSQFGSLKGLVNWQLQLEKSITASKIRKSHLEKDGKFDPETDAFLKEIEPIIHFVKGRVAFLLSKHPAYDWFSRVSGIGNENIAKVICFIDIEKAFYPSSLWKYLGYGVDKEGKADRLKKGEKSSFNREGKTMCYRLGVSLLKAHGISKNGTKYGNYYEKQAEAIIAENRRKGFWVGTLEEAKKQKIAPEKVFSMMYVHNQAIRKMIKLFLSHLWQVWREKENLPVNQPYAIAQMSDKHTHELKPEDFLDLTEAKAAGKKRAAQRVREKVMA